MRRGILSAGVAIVLLAACSGASGGPVSPSPATSTGVPSVPTSSASPAPTAVPSASAAPLAVSPSGRIAFTRPEGVDGSGQVDIYVVDAAGGTPTRVTDDSRDKQAVYWLLDGSRLVYTWTPADPYHQRLTSVRIDGSDSRDLGPVQTIYAPAAVSPDGRFVVFSGDGCEDCSSGLVLLDLLDGTRTPLTTDGATGAIWSPDGSRVLAFLPSRRIEVVDPNAGAVVALVVDPDVQWLVGWTADGRSILFHDCGPDLGKTACVEAPITAADADGTNRRVYTGPLPEAADTTSRSPDGRWIASWAGGKVVVASSSGGVPVPLGSGGPAAWSPDSTWLTWSPDSTWLVFRATAPDTTGSGEGLSRGLVVVRRDGGPSRQLTDGRYDDVVAWGPSR